MVDKSLDLDCGDVSAWRRDFIASAKKDRHREMIARLEAERERCPPRALRRMVRLTVDYVNMAYVLRAMDCWPAAAQREFLRRQVYSLTNSRARYILLFEAGGRPWPRILVNGLREVDLTGLFDAMGYRQLSIRRRDGSRFTLGEQSRLERRIRYDFAYDYRDQPIKLFFSGSYYTLDVIPRDPEETKNDSPIKRKIDYHHDK